MNINFKILGDVSVRRYKPRLKNIQNVTAEHITNHYHAQASALSHFRVSVCPGSYKHMLFRQEIATYGQIVEAFEMLDMVKYQIVEKSLC
jgi:hypothetical protein